MSNTDEWLAGDGAMWRRLGARWKTVDYPQAPDCLDHCGYFQATSLRLDPLRAGHIWGVGTYVDFSVGAPDDQGFPSGLNLIYAAHYDGVSWSVAAPASVGDADQCFWGVATRAYTNGTAGAMSDLWAAGGHAPDTVEINLGRNCLDFGAQTVVEYMGTASGSAWQIVLQDDPGNFFGAGLIEPAANGNTRMLATGFRPHGQRLEAMAQVCEDGPP